MSLISFTPVVDGTTAVAAGVNTPLSTIYNDYNGNITDANIASAAAIAGSKLASASVTSTQINFGGSGAGVWWEEVGRTTLGVAGDSLSVTFAARKYLYVYAIFLGTGGTISMALTFNSDTGSNYAYRQSPNGAADTTSTSVTSISVSGAATNPQSTFSAFISNIQAQEKVAQIYRNDAGAAGAGTAPGRLEQLGKWANTSAQITTITFSNAGTGDYAIGTEIVVLGHN